MTLVRARSAPSPQDLPPRATAQTICTSSTSGTAVTACLGPQRNAVMGSAVAWNEMAQSQGTAITQSQGTQMTQSRGTSRRDRSRGERVPGNAGYAVPWYEMTAARPTGTAGDQMTAARQIVI